MAYFPNGTAGMILDEQCDKCLIHHEWPCPVLFVQTHYNYDQIIDGELDNDLAKAINMLINEKGICQMKLLLDKIIPEYIERRNAEINGQLSMF